MKSHKWILLWVVRSVFLLILTFDIHGNCVQTPVIEGVLVPDGPDDVNDNVSDLVTTGNVVAVNEKKGCSEYS